MISRRGETSSGGEKPQAEGRNLKRRGETSSGGEKPQVREKTTSKLNSQRYTELP
jgi:hypothetical protein